MERRQGLVIGCGEFGAQVCAHMEARDSGELSCLAWTAAAGSRQAAGEFVQSRLERLEATALSELYLVAAADDTAGSGILVAAAARLAFRRPCRIWLVLPAEKADQAACTRVYATLQELAVLRREGASFALLLAAKGGDLQETAQRFGDAILYSARRRPRYHFSDWACYGFSLAVVRDPAASVRRRMAWRLAVQSVEQYLFDPDPAHLLPGLSEALQRAIRPLLTPIEEFPAFGQRCPAVSPGGGLEALLAFYAPVGPWHRRAWSTWEERMLAARTSLAAAIGHAWRSGFATIHAEARSALDLAHRSLEAEISRCQERAGELAVRFEASQAGDGGTEPALGEVDRLVAAYLLEMMRLDALERMALAIDGAVELVMDGLWAKAEQVRGLLAAVEAGAAPPTLPRTAHALAMVPSARQEQEWLAMIEPRFTRTALHTSAQPSVADLLAAARHDVDRYLRRSSPALHLPRGHRVREAWLDAALPAVRLTGGRSSGFLCEVSPALPSDYREELSERSCIVSEAPVPWFADEWLVYTETPPFSLGQLADLAEWAAAYGNTPPTLRQGVHVLAEPEAGWPTLDRSGVEMVVSAPASDGGAVETAGLAPARTALRCLLLGLVRHDSVGNLSVLLPVGQVPPIKDLAGLFHLLASGGDLAGRLEAKSAELRRDLSPSWLAGYYALLRWFQTAVLDGDRGRLDRPLLHAFYLAAEIERSLAAGQLCAAGEQWLPEAEQMIAELGSENDRLSIAAGAWRCLGLLGS